MEEAGRILMRKSCEKHGPFEDVLSNHPAFFKRVESLGFGKDFNCAGDELVHNHGANSIRTGCGTYLIVDLTNRCNMFCSPCYMDANAAGYVHELDMQDVTALLERAKSFKPQREINVLFSGGEAMLSPIFLGRDPARKERGLPSTSRCDQWNSLCSRERVCGSGEGCRTSRRLSAIRRRHRRKE